MGGGANGLASSGEVESLDQWLRLRLQVVLDDPFALATAFAAEWCDGRRLARVVCRLEDSGAHSGGGALARLAAASQMPGAFSDGSGAATVAVAP